VVKCVSVAKPGGFSRSLSDPYGRVNFAKCANRGSRHRGWGAERAGRLHEVGVPIAAGRCSIVISGIELALLVDVLSWSGAGISGHLPKVWPCDGDFSCLWSRLSTTTFLRPDVALAFFTSARNASAGAASRICAKGSIGRKTPVSVGIPLSALSVLCFCERRLSHNPLDLRGFLAASMKSKLGGGGD